MCRIAGIVNPSIPGEQLLLLVKGMCKTLAHGGPDDEGIYENHDCSLVIGHRRLSIIDISNGGHQPMAYAHNRYVISYNGELYNYKELKKELAELGACFSTQSDTEVILAAYAHWGTSAFEKFSGMFAFAIWDNEIKELMLVRDFAGIKPLYYAFTQNGFAFASEIRALRSIPWLKERNDKWPVYFMAYGHLPEPVTTLKNVQPLAKGNYLVYNYNKNSVQIKSFARYKYLELEGNRSTAIELIKSALEKSVKKHLISDAPIGVFLSGGLDSSIIAALANRQQAKIKAVSLYFQDSQYSEKKYQDALQAQLSCSRHEFLVTENDFHTNLPSVIDAMDMPCCDGINTWFISKFARQSGLKAVLSGIGGDELFGGYPSFKRIRTVLALENIPPFVLTPGGYTASKKMKRMCYLRIGGAAGRYLFLRGHFIPAEIARFLNMEEGEVWNLLSEQPQLPDINYLSPGNQASWMETNLYMQNQLLRDADTMSMAHGLEIRVPFLDKELVETVFKIKSTVKYSGKFGKQLLIDAFKNLIPEMIWNRPKMGFAFPFKEWLGDDRYAAAHNGKNISAYHKKLQAGNMHWSQFFSLLLMNQYRDAA
jgi:asparagine synthase (glutamine-hydrolysing)